MAAPEWARDLVLTEVRRAYPDEVGKERLQEELGIGPDDLRATIEELMEGGLLVEGEGGWAMDPGHEDDADFTRADGGADGTSTPGEDVAAPEGAPGALEAMLGPAGETPGPYRARIILEVMSYPEPEGGHPPDAQAVVDADEFRNAAVAGIQGRWADLQVSGTVMTVDCFGGVRRVFPRDE